MAKEKRFKPSAKRALKEIKMKTCRHCMFGVQFHLADGKCPFEASSFSPLSEADSLKLVTEIMKGWHRAR